MKPCLKYESVYWFHEIPGLHQMSKMVIFLYRLLFSYVFNASMHQVPDVMAGDDRVEAVVVDEESVGSMNALGCGGKILRGDGALERYLVKLRDSLV